jgi:hypothetical protein
MEKSGAWKLAMALALAAATDVRASLLDARSIKIEREESKSRFGDADIDSITAAEELRDDDMGNTGF